MTVLLVIAGMWLAAMVACLGVSHASASPATAARWRRIADALNHAGSGAAFLPIFGLVHQPPTWLRLVIYAVFACAPLALVLELRPPKKDWPRFLFLGPYHVLGLAALVASWWPSPTVFITVALGFAALLLLLRLAQSLFRTGWAAGC